MATGCGDDAEQSTTSTVPSVQATVAATASTSRNPKIGGKITFASNVMSSGLDPVLQIGSGSAGGIEMLALYDAIVRIDPLTAIPFS